MFIGIKYVHEVGGVTLSSGGLMVGVNIGVSVVAIISAGLLSDYVRDRNILSTTQVNSDRLPFPISNINYTN